MSATDARKDIDTVDLNTLKNKDIREMGAEWLSLQAVRELGIDRYLSSRGWSEEDVSLALSHIVSRAVYPASELKTVRFMEDNSSVCELTGYDIHALTKDKLYGISIKLFEEKQGLENYLSKKTNDLFDLQDEIILYDLTKKSGVKTYEKVLERIGRLKQKYSSAHSRYKIEVEKQVVPVSLNSKSKPGKTKEICTTLKWEKIAKLDAQKQEECGVYFLRTCIKADEETLVWTVYNCIRNVESSFRTLKTDLDLRPIFHKSDDATQAHLHLGLLAYWVVNTVRYKLQQNDIKSEWREIVRVMNTQKCVTTVVQNTREQWISIRKCSEPQDKVIRIYNALKYKYAPFIRKKSVVPKPQILKIEVVENYKLMDG